MAAWGSRGQGAGARGVGMYDWGAFKMSGCLDVWMSRCLEKARTFYVKPNGRLKILITT